MRAGLKTASPLILTLLHLLQQSINILILNFLDLPKMQDRRIRSHLTPAQSPKLIILTLQKNKPLHILRHLLIRPRQLSNLLDQFPLLLQKFSIDIINFFFMHTTDCLTFLDF